MSRRGDPNGVVALELGDKRVERGLVGDHRINEQATLNLRSGCRVEDLSFDEGMGEELRPAPFHELIASISDGSFDAGRCCSDHGFGKRGDGTGHLGMVLDDCFSGFGVGLIGGNGESHGAPWLRVCPKVITVETVKNISSAFASGYGPRGPSTPHLSRARAAVLQRLVDVGEWQTIAMLSAHSGLHGNTLREHVDALVNLGLAQRRRADSVGRGRPAWQYGASAVSGGDGTEYATLATVLAGQLAQTSADVTADAVEAGMRWGSRLVATGHDSGDQDDADRGSGEGGSDDQYSGPLATRQRVVQILDELGFDPDPDVDCKSVRLRRCPLIDAAAVHPDVVCGVHDGIVKGALQSLGADPEKSELHAFHEPGACHLQL